MALWIYFNPRTPVGCDQLARADGHLVRHFNPRTPVGCDRILHTCGTYIIDFNPRTPVGCDALSVRPHEPPIFISIHAPQWGATKTDPQPGKTDEFQSTHPSGVRPRQQATATGDKTFQSTHPSGVRRAPVRPCCRPKPFQSTHPSGVRPDTRPPKSRDCAISIHAPQWGATKHRVTAIITTKYFNPRTPVGCDRRFGATNQPRKISIHAPQWGATRLTDARRLGRRDFNPRTPVGCDPKASSSRSVLS